MKKLIKSSKYLESLARKLYSFIPYEKRKLDTEFYKFYTLLEENEKKTFEEIKRYQFEKLKQIVEIAYHHTKFYKAKYDKANFHPTMLKDLADLVKIPIITKDEIRQFSKDMIDNRVNKNQLIKSITSGTTGKSLELFSDRKTLSKEWASICYQWKRVGYKPGDGRIELRGFIENNHDFIFLPDDRVLRINIIKMSTSNIQNILNEINKRNYDFIHGYPSAIFKFAKIIQTANINYSPKSIMMASEALYDWQIEVIDKAFTCPKIIHYGQAEKVALGAWTNERKYSFIPSYGILELNYISSELISTSLINDTMPLIRYQLTDTVESFINHPISPNQTLFPIIHNIGGREEDYTYDENNNLIPPAVVTFPFKELLYIEAARIIQNDINTFELILETKYPFNDVNLQNEIQKLINDFKKIYGNQAHFGITLTDHIPLASNGKFRWIECKIK